MKFAECLVPGRERALRGRIGRSLPLFLMAGVVLLCAGCHRTPDAAPVPPGPPMTPAEANTARAQVINNDARLTPLQKQQAIQRLQGNDQPSSPGSP